MGDEADNHKNNTKESSQQEIPVEVTGWNWGAFFLTWIWGIFNGVWWSLIMFIPIGIIQLVVPFVLGAVGSKLAWKSGKWKSVEDFKRSQRKWGWAGLIVFIIQLVILCFAGIFIGKMVYSMVTNFKTDFSVGLYGGAAQYVAESKGEIPQSVDEILNPGITEAEEDPNYPSEVPLDHKGEKVKYCLDGENYYLVYWQNKDLFDDKFLQRWDLSNDERAEVSESEVSSYRCYQE